MSVSGGRRRARLGDRLAPKGQQDSAQGFNPGNYHPKRRALKGRQIKRANTGIIRHGNHPGTSRPFRAKRILWFPRVETLG